MKSVALAVAVVVAASHALAGGDDTLLDARFDAGAGGFVVGAAPAPVENGALVLKDGEARLARAPWYGDLALSGRLVLPPASRAEVRIGSLALSIARAGDSSDAEFVTVAERRELARGKVALDADGAAVFALRFRSSALLAQVNGRVVCESPAPRPISSGPLILSAAGGAVSFDDIVVNRLVWREVVRVEGADDARIRGLMDRPHDDFTLDAAAAAGRDVLALDPEYVIRVKGEDVPIRVITCGPRESGDAALSPLDQALALARIKPWMRLRVLAAETKQPIDGAIDDATITVAPGQPAVLEVAAVVGITGEWPTITVLDVTDKERILDRTVPCGAVGRATWAELADETSRVRVLLHLPGLTDVTRELNVRHAAR